MACRMYVSTLMESCGMCSNRWMSSSVTLRMSRASLGSVVVAVSFSVLVSMVISALPPLRSMPSTVMLLLNMCLRSRSTMADSMLTSHRLSCLTESPLASRSSGNAMCRASMRMSMPVASLAYEAAFCTTHLCMGGMYSIMAINSGVSNAVSSAHAVRLKTFLVVMVPVPIV